MITKCRWSTKRLLRVPDDVDDLGRHVHAVNVKHDVRPDRYLTQYVGRILRSHENKTTAEVHDYLDERTGVLAAMLAKRAPGYTGLGFSDPRRLALAPSAGMDS
jgi:hypothetical protein